MLIAVISTAVGCLIGFGVGIVQTTPADKAHPVKYKFNEEEVLHHKGKVTAAIAKAFAESEFEKYRVIQDRLYQSDFDRLVASTVEKD